ncbi:MAG TPA: DegT/DnrJ/EryC1/StrS family aminotransferase [Candidatus Acidoferrales bacterium]|nr:DegT/DnrJ/EryC1/StrS family aminotransferase [Candidatus Acidoferrales bacterium]
MSAVSARQIPLLDLQAQHKHIREEVLAEIVRVVDSQKFILGEDVKKLEGEIASYCRAKYAVGCASGSDALILALMALEIRPGDEVLTTPYTFFATAGAISRVGATPVFVDVDEHTFNLDVELTKKTLATHPKVRAMIPVHLFGGCADMDPILEIAGERGIPVIEDAAQSIGSEYKGRRAGTMGQIGTFSFFPSKNLGCYGDGGIITTEDAGLAERLAALRVHGGKKKYYHEWIGMNSRLDALQAAVLRVKLRYLDGWSEGRQKNAELYRTHLAKMAVPVAPLKPAAYQTRHIYNQFVIRGERRDALQAHLKGQGIGTEVYYPIPLHLQPCYAFLSHKKGDFPVSERLAEQSLALPVHSELAEGDIEYICETIRAFYA